VNVRFLLGPAGSGKTWRCLEEARTELLRDPVGPPLLFLAPKQATFQIERQLLDDPALPGFTRLQVTSPARLAADTLEESGSELRLLSEEGRVMVLRSLLSRHHAALEVFRTTARLTGFARRLSVTLRDCRRYQLSPNKLRQRASEAESGLAGKLRDCALLLEHYERWLLDHGLHDPDALMDVATGIVRAWPTPAPDVNSTRIHRVWLDGFAEMTPQELTFLGVLLPHSARSTLAFCLPNTEVSERRGLDPWTLVAGTYASLLSRLQHQPGSEISVEHLSADPAHSRFAHSPMLAHLEENWNKPIPFPKQHAACRMQHAEVKGRFLPTSDLQASGIRKTSPLTTAHLPAPHTTADKQVSEIRIVACPHPEAEAIVAAREILDHVHAGGRFRETAILVRSLESYHAVVQRVLRRYEIPFFLDRRESVAHHPLAELTRYALRTLVYHWQHEDWFGALKTGLLPAGAEEVDLLENEALARGWEGARWLQALETADNPHLAQQLEAIRRRVLSPLTALQLALQNGPNASSPTGEVLSRGLLGFWQNLGVAEQLDSWANLAPIKSRYPAVHSAVWEQMQTWAENLALAFVDQQLGLHEWLPVVESGLSGLSVGVIPPALDQVLVGAVDRSRNPNLKQVIVLGVHEGGFPATPNPTGLLTEAEHRELESLGARVGTDSRLQLAHERYYGYISFTRPSSRLVITWSERDAEDRSLSPSPFISHLGRLFPELALERFADIGSPTDARHACELWCTALTSLCGDASGEESLHDLVCPKGSPARQRLDRLAAYQISPLLNETTAARLYGSVLRGSVSALEKFGSCPFQFFVAKGLRAEERKAFVADAREQGSFQHEILARFHQQLTSENRHWRDVALTEARQLVRRLAEETVQEYREGLFRSAPGAVFTARALTAALEDFVEVTVNWMNSYAFNPAAVELNFGLGPDSLPAWTLELDQDRSLEFRGKIDRIDIVRPCPDGDPLAAVLRALPAVARRLGYDRIEPVGVFYVTLRGNVPRQSHRRAALVEPEALRRAAYQHRGRYRVDTLPWLDAGAPDQPSGQFNYRFKRDGTPTANSKDLLSANELSGLLNHVEHLLRSMGERILGGDIRIDPYQHHQAKACDRCDYRSICRIDPYTHEFRKLRTSPTQE
jgi:ATP-dependent helicase/nuclease subunit B